MTGRPAAQPPWVPVIVAAALLGMAWILGQTLGHVIFVFTLSVVVALLLNPLVRGLRRLHIPRGLAVMFVFLSFLGALAGAVVLLINPIRNQIEEIRANLPLYTDQAQRQVQNLQHFFDRHGINVDVQQKADGAIQAVRDWVTRLADNAVTYSLDVLSGLVTFVIIVVACIYMLLDAPRIARFAQRIGGPEAGAFLRRTERTLTEYVKAQLLVSLIIGVSSGVAMWIYGVTGIFPAGATYAALFAAWVFVMEFIPYIGPILGAVPPVLLALFTSPITALWVVVAFVAIHQLEGHVVVPQIMGDAVGVHPLVVIFGLLVGEQLYGLPGILLAIPVIVIVKETIGFVMDRLGLARWEAQAHAPPPVPAAEAEAAAAPAAEGEATGETAPHGTVPTRVMEAPGVRPE